MKTIKTSDKNFRKDFDELLKRGHMDMDNVSVIVLKIINEIKKDGNKALKSHIAKFDDWTPKSDEELKISCESMKKAYDELDTNLKNALQLAYNRIKSYHQKQKPTSWLEYEDNGSVLGQKVTPVD